MIVGCSLVVALVIYMIYMYGYNATGMTLLAVVDLYRGFKKIRVVASFRGCSATGYVNNLWISQ